MKKVERFAREQNVYNWIIANLIPNEKKKIKMSLGKEHAGVLTGDRKVKLIGSNN